VHADGIGAFAMKGSYLLTLVCRVAGPEPEPRGRAASQQSAVHGDGSGHRSIIRLLHPSGVELRQSDSPGDTALRQELRWRG